MAKRYYLSEIIGDGSLDNPHRLAVYDLVPPDQVKTVTPNQRDDGSFVHPVGLAVVEVDDHAPLLADKRLHALPEFPLDGKLNAMRTPTLNALNGKVQSAGMSPGWSNSDGYRDVIRSLGTQLLGQSFDEDQFDKAV